MRRKLLAVTAATFFLAGCAAIPPSIQGDANLLANVNYTEINKNTALYKGKEVRLGGKVINVINNKNETLFEVAVLPLDSSARPETNSSYQGRIMVKAASFIDPLSIKNHLITVLATVSGDINGKVGNANYKFLTLDLINYQVWHVENNIVPLDTMNYGFGPYWQNNWGPYMPGWGWYPSDTSYQVEKQLVP